MALMKEVVPGGNVEPMRRPDLGAVVMLEEADKTTQRIALMQDGDNPRAVHLASRAETASPGALPDRTGATTRRTPSPPARNLAGPSQCAPGLPQRPRRPAPVSDLPPGDRRLHPQLGRQRLRPNRRMSLRHHPGIPVALAPENRYAAPEDDQGLETFLKRLGHRDTHLRPSIRATVSTCRRWLVI